jgi:putative ABC transport system permease protein
MAFHQTPQQRLDMDIVNQFPNITSINIQDSITQAQDILGQLIFAIQVLFIFTLLAGFVVLMISLISTQEQRMKEVAILKTLGASESFLLHTWLIELVFCGGIAGLLSGVFASIAGWYLANYQLEIEMAFPYWIIFLGVVLGVCINGLASLFLKKRTFSTSPTVLLKT